MAPLICFLTTKINIRLSLFPCSDLDHDIVGFKNDVINIRVYVDVDVRLFVRMRQIFSNRGTR